MPAVGLHHGLAGGDRLRNVLPGVRSYFRWKGELCEEDELLTALGYAGQYAHGH